MAKHKRRARAETADPHELYEYSVQDPPTEVEFTTSAFHTLRGREPMSLREDFCGTGVFSLAWVKSHPARTAVAIDLDRATLHWGLEQRIRPAGHDYASRITLRNANVLEPDQPNADVVVAFNFSYWTFETRESLRAYFEAARAGLRPDGVLFLDAYGGTEVQMPDINEREVEDDEGVVNGGEPFTYIWEQFEYDPLTAHMECGIHFVFEDGSRIDRAYTYSWRIWTLPELRELLLEAGFRKVRVWAEEEDEDGEGTGRYVETQTLDNEGVWWIYLSAENG